MLKYVIPGVGIVAALFAFLVFSGKIGSNEDATVKGQIVMWGTLPQEAIEPILGQFNIQAKTYSVTYQEFPETRFSSILTEALASGEGPDMILAPYQTILAQSARIAPFPYESFSRADFQTQFVDGASIFLRGDGILAFPVSIEPLVLFLNSALFTKHGVETFPTSLEQVIVQTPNLTVRDRATGRFSEHGIALGAASNIPYAKDILMTLVNTLGQSIVSVQDGAYVVTANTPTTNDSPVLPLRESLRFFTQFSDASKSVYSWSPALPYSSEEAFLSEKLAMHIGYSGDEIRMRSKNPRLNILTLPFPQPGVTGSQATGMRLYGIAVMKRTDPSLLVTAYTSQISLGTGGVSAEIAASIGGMTPLRALLSQDRVIDPNIKRAAVSASGWPDIFPEKSQALFTAMVDSVISGRQGVADAADTFVQGLQNLYAR